MLAIDAAALKLEYEHGVRVQAAAPEMESWLRSLVADHSVFECSFAGAVGPCWPHRILEAIDVPRPTAPDLNDPDGGRRGD